jgi:NAD(P)-dependent dehydrogenase (short-subunit alcohol dehydrogenase family)
MPGEPSKLTRYISSTTIGSVSMAPKYAIIAVPAYKVSKAALNMLTVQYAQSYAKEGFTFLAISPGVSVTCWIESELKFD